MSKLNGYSRNLPKIPKILPNTYQSSLNPNGHHPSNFLLQKQASTIMGYSILMLKINGHSRTLEELNKITSKLIKKLTK